MPESTFERMSCTFLFPQVIVRNVAETGSLARIVRWTRDLTLPALTREPSRFRGYEMLSVRPTSRSS